MRVLVAADGSPSAQVPLDLVRDLRWEGGTALRVLQVVPPLSEVRFVGADRREALDRIESEQLNELQRVADSLRRGGVAVEATLVRGDAVADAIIADATQWKADLAVTGSRGHGLITNMLLGSVASAVIDRAPCPVLVARQPTCARIVFAEDGSESATQARHVLATWPVFRGLAARVVSIAHVTPTLHAGIPPTLVAEAHRVEAEILAEARATHERLASEGARELRAAGLPAEAAVRSGDAASAILAEAAELDADLIVMGSRGRSGVTRMFLGSVARNVLLHATSSVLIVRGGVRSRTTGTIPERPADDWRRDDK
jgi:nucleotide-binding universal stress UspA family protein